MKSNNREVPSYEYHPSVNAQQQRRYDWRHAARASNRIMCPTPGRLFELYEYNSSSSDSKNYVHLHLWYLYVRTWYVPPGMYVCTRGMIT